MQFLISLVAIGFVIYGVISGNLLWVLAGVAVVALLSSGRLGSASTEDVSGVLRFGKKIIGPPWRQLVLAALACSTLAAGFFRFNESAATSAYLWLAGLALIVAAGIVYDRSEAKSGRPRGTAPTGSGAGGDEEAEQSSGRWRRLDWILASVLTLVALGLRLYQLSPLLPPVHGDEGEMGMLALLALRGPASGVSLSPLPLFATGFLDHPTLFHYLQAASMMLFGANITGLRMISVLCGALCVPLLYDIGRRGWGRVAGMTAGWLMAVSHSYIQFSRIALNNIETVLSVILLIWLLFLAYQANAPRAAARQDSPQGQNEEEPPNAERSPTAGILLFVAIGLVIGLGQYFYYGSRLLPVLALVAMALLWFKKRITLLQAVVVVVAAVVAYLPLAFYYANDLPAFYARLKGVSVFTATGMAHTLGPAAQWPQDIPLLLWTQIKLNLLFFLNYGDHSSFYLADLPAFDQITIILFWLGLGILLTHIRRYYDAVVLVWLGVGVLLAGVVTTDAPNAPRLIVATPALFLTCGIFLQSVADFSVRNFPGAWTVRSRWLGYGVMALLAVSTLYLNFHTYFVEYQAARPNLTQSYVAEEIAENSSKVRTYLLGSPNIFVNSGALRFVALGAEKYDLEGASDLAPLLAQRPSDKGALIIALPQHFPDLEEIEKEYPHGDKRVHTSPKGIPLYISYQIPAAELTKAPAK